LYILYRACASYTAAASAAASSATDATAAAGGAYVRDEVHTLKRRCMCRCVRDAAAAVLAGRLMPLSEQRETETETETERQKGRLLPL
jgi:hypothetical protein